MRSYQPDFLTFVTESLEEVANPTSQIKIIRINGKGSIVSRDGEVPAKEDYVLRRDQILKTDLGSSFVLSLDGEEFQISEPGTYSYRKLISLGNDAL